MRLNKIKPKIIPKLYLSMVSPHAKRQFVRFFPLPPPTTQISLFRSRRTIGTKPNTKLQSNLRIPQKLRRRKQQLITEEYNK